MGEIASLFVRGSVGYLWCSIGHADENCSGVECQLVQRQFSKGCVVVYDVANVPDGHVAGDLCCFTNLLVRSFWVVGVAGVAGVVVTLPQVHAGRCTESSSIFFFLFLVSCRRLNMGLAKFDALTNVPVFQCLWMLFGVISGGVFFREFSAFDPLQSFMFPLGVSFCLAGVFVLSSRPTAMDEKDAAGEDNNDSDSDSDTSSESLSSSLLTGGSSGSSSPSDAASDYSTSGGSNNSTLGYDAQDYPNRMELPEYDAVFYDGPMGLGLYPEIVKITHPQYERIQGMVKVWRVKDLPRVPGDGEAGSRSGSSGGSHNRKSGKIRNSSNADGVKESESKSGSSRSSSSTSSSTSGSDSSSSNGGIFGSDDELQPGPAEKQEITKDMMLVGINGESILRQRNTWRETLLRLMHTARPMVLTFRIVPEGSGLLPDQSFSSYSGDGSGVSGVSGVSGDSGDSLVDAASKEQSPVPPNTPNAIRGSRDGRQTSTTPNGFVDMIHAGQISLSENRKRSTDSRGNLRFGPKSTNGRLRYKKLHGSQSVGRRRRTRSSRTGTKDVLDSHSKLQHRPMMSGTLTMFHQPASIAFGGRYVLFLCRVVKMDLGILKCL